MDARAFDFRGIPAIRLQTPDGATAVVSRYGAQVLSWIPVGGGERLYLSERAQYSEGAPLRGGVPVLFPQFGTYGSGPRHGFARCREWLLEEARQHERFATATFRLGADERSRALWPHAFAAELTVMLEGNRLDIELLVTNTDTSAFEFTAALHTYLLLGNVELTRLEGLEGLEYLDAASNGKRCRDNRHALLVDDEVDRVYLGLDKPLLLTESHRQLAVEQSGFTDVVIWNPWEEKTRQLPDMAPLDFKRMLCVEAAAVEPPVRLAPGEEWAGRQTLSAL